MTLRTQLRGELIQPGEAHYDEARKVYNTMIDKHPALVARCTAAADVISAIFEFKRQTVRHMVTKVEVHDDKTTTVHIESRSGADDEQTTNTGHIEITPDLSPKCAPRLSARFD